MAVLESIFRPISCLPVTLFAAQFRIQLVMYVDELVRLANQWPSLESIREKNCAFDSRLHQPCEFDFVLPAAAGMKSLHHDRRSCLERFLFVLFTVLC
jgi:hypothetical protein